MKDYTINFTTNTIIISKSFQTKASKMGTDAFKTMMRLRKLNMPIVIKDAPRKSSSNRLTYKKIKNYLSTFEDKEARLAAFEKVRNESLVQDNPYKYVIEWFDKTYPIRVKKPTPAKITALPKAVA